MTKEYSSSPQDTSRIEATAVAEITAVPYRPVPAVAETPFPWRVRLDILSEPGDSFGLDIQGELVLGRDIDQDNLVDLSACSASEHGVSRQHALLRPTATNLFIIDLGSTNGTTRNGRSIGVKTPYALVNGDVIGLGGLRLAINIIERPSLQKQTDQLRPKRELVDALSRIAKAITSQLDVDEVLNQVAETAMLLTAAGETGIWLVDEQSGELFLEAERGIKDESIRRMRLPIREGTLVGKVIQSGQPLRASHLEEGDQIKVKTNYLVEAIVYVPIKLGGVTLGVISAVHRQPGKQFERRDERLLEAIADFAAIAIQNARLYQATDEALARRVKELSALNELSYTVSASLELKEVYQVLVEQVNKNWQIEGLRLYLLNEQRDGLQPIFITNNDHQVVPASQGILWQVVQQREPIAVNDPVQHPHYYRPLDGLQGQDSDSIACVPLLIQADVVGVLALFNKAGGTFSGEDVERLQAFANPLATAIKNARLFAESERQRRAIQAMAQTLSQPLLILDQEGRVLVANEAAQSIFNDHMSPLFQGISEGAGQTREVVVADHTYLSTVQHMPEVGTIVVMQDITYVKQLEQDRADFLHALSHDLKSPLTSIAGYAQLLQKVIELDRKSEHYLSQILSASERLLSMINQLLQVAKGDVVELEREACDLHKIAAQVVGDVEGSALSKSIVVNVSVEGEPVAIVGDATRLYHMILNLVDNAIKYSPAQTAVSVRLIYTDETAVLCVQDEGPGIPDKDLPRIFDKYYRGDQAKYQPGAGLGLSVVWAIAQAHDGRATVHNAAEGGAVFTVTLPIANHQNQ
jgi:K+-sensing histidine kinase KdpD